MTDDERAAERDDENPHERDVTLAREKEDEDDERDEEAEAEAEEQREEARRRAREEANEQDIDEGSRIREGDAAEQENPDNHRDEEPFQS